MILLKKVYGGRKNMGKENLSDRETASMEAEIRARREGYNSKETVQHYGSAENLSDRETESMEAEIKVRRGNYNTSEFQHYGSVENLDDAGIRSMEAQVAEKRKQDIPYKEYFKTVISRITSGEFDDSDFMLEEVCRRIMDIFNEQGFKVDANERGLIISWRN